MLRPGITLRKPFWAHPDFRAVIVMGALAIGMAAWHGRASAAHRTTLVERGVRAGLTPLQAAFMRGAETATDVAHSITSAGSLAKQNRELQEERDRLIAENQYLKYLHFDVSERMRDQLGLSDQSPVAGAPAQVVAGTGERGDPRIRIRVARGYDVGERDAVCTAAGLVGNVDAVEGSTAWVRLIMHPDSAVAAMIQRTGELGMVRGPKPDEPYGVLRMEYLQRGVDARVGDAVLTSGRGGIYPRGLRIGTVKAITPAMVSDVSVAALVEPAADLDRVEYVRLVRRPE